jgi:hypothetical protein
MISLATLRLVLTVIQIGGYAAVLTKVFRLGLQTKYRSFALYVVWELLRLVAILGIPYRSAFYAQFYIATQPISWILLVLAILEIFQLVLRTHVGIATLGRKVLTMSLIASTVVSCMTLFVDLQTVNVTSALLDTFALLERLVLTSVLLLVLCLTMMLAYFPVPITPNVRLHTCIFAAYFFIKTVLAWARTIWGVGVLKTTNPIAQITMALCLLAWAVWMNRAGEIATNVRRPSSDDEARLLGQLDAINQTLLKSARK